VKFQYFCQEKQKQKEVSIFESHSFYI